MSINLFRKKSIAEVGAQLNVHPFDIARYFGQKEGGLPLEMLFDASDVTKIATGMRIEFWWRADFSPQDSNYERGLICELARKLLKADLSKPTRSDNLCRGLEGEDYQLILKAVKILIMMEVLQSVATSDGFDVELAEGTTGVLEAIADGSDIPAELQALM